MTATDFHHGEPFPHDDPPTASPASNRRVRIARVTVQIEAFVDDGDQLVPLQVQPVTYLAGDWPLFDLDHVRALLQRQVDNAELPAGQAQPEAVHSDG